MPPLDPKRFTVSPRTLWVDRLMSYFIKVGGVLIIITVLGIFLFILFQVFPLFQKATVTPSAIHTLPTAIPRSTILGVDEWGELPFVIGHEGTFHFIDLAGDRGGSLKERAQHQIAAVTAATYHQDKQQVLFGNKKGQCQIIALQYEPRFEGEGQRTLEVTLQAEKPLLIGRRKTPIIAIDYGEAEHGCLIAAIQETPQERELHALRLGREDSLVEPSRFAIKGRYSLNDLITGAPFKVIVNAFADGLLVATKEGMVFFLKFQEGMFHQEQRFKPFKDLADPTVASMDFLLGKQSVSFTHPSGAHRLYSLCRRPGESQLQWGLTKTFPALSGPATFFAGSLRNRAFLLGSGSTASLCFSTTETVRWQATLPFHPNAAVITGKFDKILFLDDRQTLHLYKLHDPHPEAGLKAFFGKIWYEGESAPTYIWQSSGGTDKFEPKLSLIPLIVGSFKGTLYALLFAVPIALLSALYTAQFLRPEFKRIFKPTMEIMASLPSVVLGFIGALWFAPLVGDKVPSLLLIFIGLPLLTLGVGRVWLRLPFAYRNWLKPGYEFLVLAPLLLIGGYLFWELGPVLEQKLFVVTDPNAGKSFADFRLWWPERVGASYDQRNSLVVGFMMGFAVIPIIFTIAEDALSNVPPSLVSGSSALGASRWQTARLIVLPVALPGIFSAFMIGLGRAVGETMIVVMATGNTPIMEWNPFSGFRALSANIAVELPEAPQYSTLYRTLFLGALVLFVLTFCVNTVAEIIRQQLRAK